MPTQPSSRSATPRLTDRKREAIVRAAVHEFRSAGYDATSMDRIAAAAGVSKRTVYNHFPSKDELFALMLEQLWESSEASTDAPYRAEVSLESQLRQVLMHKLTLLSDPDFIDLARVGMAEIIRSPARARDIVGRMQARENGVTVWIRAAMADGRLVEVDAQFAAQQLLGLVKGFAFWPQVTFGQSPLPAAEQARVADSAVAMFLGRYAALSGPA